MKGYLGKKVCVAMSGGVDSSVSTALLLDAGYDVEGVHLRIRAPEWTGCTSAEDERDAARVAAVLGIPFHVLDYTDKYKEYVIQTMLDDYKVGRTPNPDVICNRDIKFGLLYDWMVKNEYAYIATGHYSNTSEGRLFRAKDENKDQSYFLWTLSSAKLIRTLFPIGVYDKKDVRLIAEKFGLPVAKKKDSQGLCFVGKLNMKEFLKRNIGTKEGNVLDTNGNILGRHKGAILYTEGERRGFTVNPKSSSPAPLFVVGKNVLKNTITVSGDKVDGDSSRKIVNIVNTNWILDMPKVGEHYLARVRYRQPLQRCVVSQNSEETSAVVHFEAPQLISSGQSLVLYSRDECMGGGIIC